MVTPRSSSKRLVSLSIFPPALSILVWRTTSKVRALSTFFSPVTFLTSTLSLPTEMLQSQRMLLSPSPGMSMTHLMSWISCPRNSLASAGVDMSGSVTISARGMPERL